MSLFFWLSVHATMFMPCLCDVIHFDFFLILMPHIYFCNFMWTFVLCYVVGLVELVISCIVQTN